MTLDAYDLGDGLSVLHRHSLAGGAAVLAALALSAGSRRGACRHDRRAPSTCGLSWSFADRPSRRSSSSGVLCLPNAVARPTLPERPRRPSSRPIRHVGSAPTPWVEVPRPPRASVADRGGDRRRLVGGRPGNR